VVDFHFHVLSGAYILLLHVDIVGVHAFDPLEQTVFVGVEELTLVAAAGLQVDLHQETALTLAGHVLAVLLSDQTRLLLEFAHLSLLLVQQRVHQRLLEAALLVHQAALDFFEFVDLGDCEAFEQVEFQAADLLPDGRDRILELSDVQLESADEGVVGLLGFVHPLLHEHQNRDCLEEHEHI